MIEMTITLPCTDWTVPVIVSLVPFGFVFATVSTTFFGATVRCTGAGRTSSVAPIALKLENGCVATSVAALTWLGAECPDAKTAVPTNPALIPSAVTNAAEPTMSFTGAFLMVPYVNQTHQKRQMTEMW